jgi:HrpA-like RNA helicase
MMTEFPLPPRQSRIIVEAMLKYPYVSEETIIAAAFLSTQSPYLLPPGEEMDARRAHHRFRDSSGDFVSYLKLYKAFKESHTITQFCEKNYLDERAMAEISNVVVQLEEIVSSIGFPLLSGGGIKQYLSCIAKGMIQFVCVKEGRNMYRTLTADRIFIHPGSAMFKMDPQYIVAGEIVKTTRMYAMSVSPLSREDIEKINPYMVDAFQGKASAEEVREKGSKYFTNTITISNVRFEVVTIKGKKIAILPWEKLREIKDSISRKTAYPFKAMRGCITLNNNYRLLEGEKLGFIFSLINHLDIDSALSRTRPPVIDFNSKGDLSVFIKLLPTLQHPAVCKEFKRELLFVCLTTDNQNNYRFDCFRGFHRALNESLASLENLIDELEDDIDAEVKNLINQNYQRLISYLS